MQQPNQPQQAQQQNAGSNAPGQASSTPASEGLELLSQEQVSWLNQVLEQFYHVYLPCKTYEGHV